MPRPVDQSVFKETRFCNKMVSRTRKSKKRRNKKCKAKSSCWDDISHLEESGVVDNDISDVSNQNDSVLISETSQINFEEAPPKVSSLKNAKKRKIKLKDENEGSSEEERWLHAIESGKLEEVDDELKKIKPKDPKLMTARQRAMLERKTDKDVPNEQLFSLPSGYREKPVTVEMQEQKAKKLQKRKQAADEKRENDKKKTMEKLLRKSESKSGKIHHKLKSKQTGPTYVYLNKADSVTISVPVGLEFPIHTKIQNEPYPKPELCGVSGCGNLRKYSCSKTGIPLCSLNCYRVNLIKKEQCI